MIPNIYRELDEEEEKEVKKNIKQYERDPPYAIEHELLRVWVRNIQDGSRITWKLKDDAHTKRVRDIVLAAGETHDEAIKQADKEQLSMAHRIRAYDAMTKGVLEAALAEFDYEQAANNIAIGPGVLGQLAQELYGFLVLNDGLAGHRRSLMLSSSEALNRSNLLKRELKNSRSSDTSRTGSGRSKKSRR